MIQTPDALRALCDELAAARVLAVDTESDQFHAYEPRTCVIQVAANGRVALIDALAFDPETVAPLRELLEDEDMVKVLHAARNDLLALQRDFEIFPTNLFDTYEAVRFLGYPKHGLDALLEHHHDIKVSKRHQRFNWRIRPLPPSVRDYAAGDVKFLVELRELLRGELDRAGWLEAHTELCATLAETTRFEPSPFDPDGWARIRGRGRLTPHQQNVLRELYLWRHDLCSAINRAPLFVATDSVLVDIARRCPVTTDGLESIRGLPRATVERQGEAILACVERGRGEPAPRPKRGKGRSNRRGRSNRGQMSAAENARYEALREWRNDTAAFHELPVDLVAANDLLRAIARAAPRSFDQLRHIDGLQDWQVDHFGAALIELTRLMAR